MIMKVKINPEQCKIIGKVLESFKIIPNIYCRRPKTLEGKEKEASLWFYLVAICHDTKSLQGTIDNEWLKGWDYLVAALRKKQDSDSSFFTAERISKIKADELKSILPTISGVEKRTELLNDCAVKLLKNFDGRVMNLFKISKGFLKREDGKGLLDILNDFEAYKDPLQKKSLVFLHYCRDARLLDMRDPQNLKMPIDYHMMRVALRTGIIDILDKNLERKLKNRENVTTEDDLEIRSRAQKAYENVSKHSGFDVAQLDLIIWSLGRSCCDWRHEPFCAGNKCNIGEKCTLIKNVEVDCNKSCPLDGVCLGSKDKEFKKFYETNITTTYY